MENSEDFSGFEPELSGEEESSTQPNNENRENSIVYDGDDQSNDEAHQSSDNDPKKRAAIWKHFTEIVDEAGNKYARCKHAPCTNQYLVSGKSNSSTGNMIRHIKNKHPGEYEIETAEEEEAFIFSQDKFRQALLKWVVTCDQPFSALKDEAFVELVKTLNPLAHIVCDKTIRADLMVEFEKKIEHLKTELAEVPGKISISLDGWTSKHGLPFLAIRGHWVDDQWQLKSKLLDFAYIEGSHDGQNHSVILTDCLRTLNVPFSKILAITGDNAGSNDTLFQWLDEYGISAVTSQVRCLAHVINLAAQDMLAALKVPSHCDDQYDDYLKNEASGCCGSTKKRTIVGGWAWAWWLVTDVQRLSLEVMTLNPMCEGVETAQGVPLTVTGVAQCKIMKMMNVYYFHHQADELLGTASEQFLGKSVKEIKQTILQTLEGHLRAILGTLTVEEVYKDRDQFAALVREVAAPDVGRMGIEILSFTIKDVYDDVQYLASLGKSQTASVKRDADTGVAEANRDAGIREAECEKSAMDVKYSTDTKIEDNARMFKLQKAHFDQEINTAKAESQLAYELQAAKIRQKIRNEEIQIDIVERRKQIEIESQEVERKERELMATVRLPADAENYRVQLIAEGKRTQTVEVAKAEAERIKKIGAAEASAIEVVGKAEAEKMRMKAAVYKQYGDAAIMNIVLEALPKIAAEISAPLAKTDEIVLIGGSDNCTGDVTRLVGQLPPAISALTGVDLSKVLSKLPGATISAKA